MASNNDYYDILGVSKTATDAEIKSAYRKLAVKYHPDRQVGKSDAEKKEAEEKFKEVAEAYSVLSDAQKRQRYDQFGKAGVDGSAGGFGGFSGASAEDIFSQVFGDFFGGGSGGGFGGFSGFGGFGGGNAGGGRTASRQGSSIRARIKLSLQEIAKGCEKKLKVPHYVSCPDCKGTGAQDNSFSTCSQCHGSGYVTRVQRTILGAMQTQTVCPACGGDGKIITKKCAKCNGDGIVKQDDVVSFNVPAGVQSGMQLTVRGKGNAPRHGGEPGDLLVVIEEEPDNDLIRDEDDIIYNALIPVYTAVLGGTIEIPTIEGKAKIKIEPGTQPNKILRLKGKGLPNVQHYGTGDLLVHIGVYIPETLTKDEKKIFEKMETSDSFTPTQEAKDAFKEHFKSMCE
ncbi:MAG: molecular chaperone DnaJ [Paludibacteraceae bacterium]|jgi:molecular chaperone DnaJ|nr:molecular chaperone DnaJ [Paludibacteraceae bacterium]